MSKHHGIEFKSLITERCMTVSVSDLQDLLWIPLQVYNSKNIPKTKDILTLSTNTQNKRIEKKKMCLSNCFLSNFEISVIRYCEEVSLVQSFSGEGLPCLFGCHGAWLYGCFMERLSIFPCFLQPCAKWLKHLGFLIVSASPESRNFWLAWYPSESESSCSFVTSTLQLWGFFLSLLIPVYSTCW